MKYTLMQKMSVVEHLLLGDSLEHVCKEYKVKSDLATAWRHIVRKEGYAGLIKRDRNKHYSTEEQDFLVREVVTRKRHVQDVAEEYGVEHSHLTSWVEEAKIINNHTNDQVLARVIPYIQEELPNSEGPHSEEEYKQLLRKYQRLRNELIKLALQKDV